MAIANEATRTEVIRRAVEALPEDAETLRVPWRGQMVRMPIIRLRLDCSVLNPRSHRIKSQLESDPLVAKMIAEEPDSEAAQEGLRRLLRTGPGFDALKQNLKDEGQREAGIVTESGLLINANTRAVALNDLDVEYIEVAVLPSDATIGELYDLELDLQVAQDYRQDYSFTNELLFVEDLITEQDRDEREVASRLRWATPSKPSSVAPAVERVRRYVRHLDLIRDIQKMSGGKIPLTDFDDAEQALQEFDKAYEALRDKDPIAAKRLRQARILGLLVDLGYERQRLVNADWVEEFLFEALLEHSELRDLVDGLAEDGEETTTATGDDSLADFEDERDGAGDAASTEHVAHRVVSALVQRLSTTGPGKLVRLRTPTGEKDFDRDALKLAINEAMRTAAEDAKATAKAGGELVQPEQLTEEAASRFVRARTAFERVQTHDDFQLEPLREAVARAERALDALKMAMGAGE